MIIQNILEWKNPYTGVGLLEHLEHELERLEERVKSSPKFEEKYYKRSDEMPATILDKKQACLDLVRRWQDARNLNNIELSNVDKTIISDLAQFVLTPFVRFGSSVAMSAAGSAGLMSAWSGSNESDWVSLSQRAEHLSDEHRHLGQLLVELCDATNYPIPPHVRTICSSPFNNQRGLL